MPLVILALIFIVWFGLGIASKVALGVTLVFFIVFFNAYQGIREVSPVVLANARMLGASPRQLLGHVYLLSAMSWVFASLHDSVGLAFVGAVVGEYLGSAEGVGYLIHQAEGVFDINTAFAGILLLTGFALVLDWVVGALEKRSGSRGAARRSGSRGAIQASLADSGLTRLFAALYNSASLPVAGWSSLAARRAHNPKVIGSNPIPATIAL